MLITPLKNRNSYKSKDNGMRKQVVFLFIMFLFLSLGTIQVSASDLQTGVSYLKQNNLSEALKSFTGYLHQNRNDPSGLYYLGVTLKKMGENARAQRAFEAALKLNPTSELQQYIKKELSSSTSRNLNISSSAPAHIRKIQKVHNKENYLDNVTPNGRVSRWELSKMPLKVYIHSGAGIEGYQNVFKSKIISALRTWQSAMKNRIRFITINSPQNADIKITWIDKFDGHKIGENPFVSLKDTILRSDINISTVMPDGRTKTTDEVYTVTLHELGHALGMQGHSPHPEDLMYYSLNPANNKSRLSQRDVNTMELLYKLDADVSNSLPLNMASTKNYYRLMLEAEQEVLARNFKNALKYYQDAMKIYDKDFLTHFNMAVCYTNLGDYTSAIKYYESADRITPGDVMVRFNMAISQINYANQLDPTDRSKLTHFQKALYNLNSIKNRNDSPPETAGLADNLQKYLNTYQ
jgi:tetratricopeptide (TPR) repeat protein